MRLGEACVHRVAFSRYSLGATWTVTTWNEMKFSEKLMIHWVGKVDDNTIGE